MAWTKTNFTVVSCPTNHLKPGQELNPADVATWLDEGMLPVGTVLERPQGPGIPFKVLMDDDNLTLVKVSDMLTPQAVRLYGAIGVDQYLPIVLETVVPLLRGSLGTPEIAEQLNVPGSTLRYWLGQAQHRGLVGKTCFWWTSVYITEAGEEYLRDYNQVRECEAAPVYNSCTAEASDDS
jgi:hypothetical protein